MGVTARMHWRKGRGHPADWVQLLVERVGSPGSHLAKNFVLRNPDTDKVEAEVFIAEDLMEDLGNPTSLTVTLRQGNQMEGELAIPGIAGDPVE